MDKREQNGTNRIEKNTVRKHGRAIRILFLLVLLCVAAAGTLTLYAKYYAKESRKSVATASGLYFSSNYLENTAQGGQFRERTNVNRWDGQDSCQIEIEIRNYNNILLYNDANLNITYDLYVQMLEAPETTESYEITYKEADAGGSLTDKTITLTDTTEHKITGCYLAGGQARANKVVLKVTPDKTVAGNKVDSTYRSKRVKVWAVPTAPEYVADSFLLGAIISASPSKDAFSYKGSFEISRSLEGKTWEQCKNLIELYSGFVYTLQTNGELDESYDGKKLVLTWNHKYLDIDMYNDYYNKAKNNGNYSTSGDESTITLEIVSYMSMKFDFYKTADFSANNFSSASDFENLVQVTIQ